MATIIPNTSFSVKFNLTGGPLLVITDTTTSAPTGFVGIVSITSPDGYTRSGNISSPDITAAGGSYSYTLILDSSGAVQVGSYKVVMTAAAPGYLSTDYTRTFTFDYSPATLVLTEQFDVFNPILKYKDDSSYAVSNYSYSGLTRAWTAVSTPTGTLTSTTQYLDLLYASHYYDCYYTITLSSSALYTHNTYSWLTVQETVSKTITTYAQTPTPMGGIIGLISALKTSLDNYDNTVQAYYDARESFEFSQTLFLHIIDRIRTNQSSDIFVDLKTLLGVLYNYNPPTYVPLNTPIYPYDLGLYFPGAIWGQLTGLIVNQYDLVAYIAAQITAQGYAADIGNGSSSTFDISHGLNSLDVLATVVKKSTGETVWVNTTRPSSGVVRISFASAPTTNQYRVIIQK